MPTPGNQVYALRLRVRADEPDALAGEIEQVRSGERRSFACGEELIEQLRRLHSPPAGPQPAGAARATPPADGRRRV